MTTPEPAIWLTDPAAYQDKLSVLLGDRDPLEVMASTPVTLAEIVSRHSAETMRVRPFEGKWTPSEIVGHLTDTEFVFGYRMRAILCEDNPKISGMDQELWVIGQRYNEPEPSELVDMFRGLRTYNLALWRRMSPEDLKRTGTHEERGPESLELMMRMEAGHDLSHIDQIQRYLAAITAVGDGKDDSCSPG